MTGSVAAGEMVVIAKFSVCDDVAALHWTAEKLAAALFHKLILEDMDASGMSGPQELRGTRKLSTPHFTKLKIVQQVRTCHLPQHHHITAGSMDHATDDEFAQMESSLSSEEEETLTGNDKVSGWHNRRCNLPDLHSYNGAWRCLTCYSSNVNPTPQNKPPQNIPPQIFGPIRQRMELRLLSIKPGQFVEDVHCWLLPCTIDKLPAYEAISYTWADESGDTAESKQISLNNVPFPVTSNCEAALKRARLPVRARTVWIDAVCIDQQNNEERGHQVQLMPKIYAGARRVLIYLGELTNEESMGVSYISERLNFNQVLRLCDAPNSLGIVSRALSFLFSRRYFSRVWILQEVSLAKEALVLCGEYEVSWKRLRDLIPLYFNKHNPLPKVLEFDRPKYRDPSKLLDLLDMARDSNAKDPRDKVFAVFGMINCAENLGYVADYKEEPDETYRRIAVLLSDAHGLMAVLVRATCHRKIERLPLWVIDWSSPDSNSRRMSISDAHGNFPTILTDKKRHEIEFIGAQVCNLETLLGAGYYVEVSISDKGLNGPFSVRMSQLESLYRKLKLPKGDSLWIYATLRNPDRPSCSSVNDFERRLAWHSTEHMRKLDVINTLTDTFLLSAGEDFCFRGLCILLPTAIDQIGGAALEKHLWRGDTMDERRMRVDTMKYIDIKRRLRWEIELLEKVRMGVQAQIQEEPEGIAQGRVRRERELLKQDLLEEGMLQEACERWRVLDERWEAVRKLEGELQPTRLRLKRDQQPRIGSEPRWEQEVQVQVPPDVVEAAAGNMWRGEKVMVHLLEKRGDQVQITHDVVMAAAGNEGNGEKVMALLLEKRGDQVQITHSVVTAAAGNEKNGEKVMALLLEKCGNKVQITPDAVIAAAWNKGNGKKVMALLLERRGNCILMPNIVRELAKDSQSGEKAIAFILEVGGDQVKITQNVVTAAAGNEGNGEKVMALLLEKRGDQVQITHGVVTAAAGNKWCGEKVMALLLEKRGDQVKITDDVVTAAAGNEGNGEKVMALLLKKRGDDVQITHSVVTAAAGNKWCGEKVMALLLEKRGDQVKITHDVVMAAAGNKGCGEKVMALLLKKRGDDVQITPDVVKAAIRNKRSGEKVMALLEKRGGDVQITPDVVIAVVENKGDGKEVIKLLLEKLGYILMPNIVGELARDSQNGEKAIALLLEVGGDQIQITPDVVIAVAGNEGGERVMALLLEKRGDQVKITHDVVIAAAGNKGCGEKVMALLLEKRGDDVQITPDVATAAAGNKWCGEKVMALVLEKRGDDVQITPDVVTAAAGNNWCGEKVIALLLEKRGGDVQITPDVVTAAAGNKWCGEKVMALLEKRGD
ncbi:Heterokaryon incompatibility protein (HET) domain containing protein [Rhypophila decipiens]